MSSAKPWLYFLYCIFPLPMFFLVLLSLPLPSRFRYPIRRTILRILDSLIFLRVGTENHSFSVIFFIIILATTGFLYSINETWNLAQRESQTLLEFEKSAIKGKRWRAERNFWISLLGLVLWIILYRVRGLLKEADELKSNQVGSSSPEDIERYRLENEELKEEKKILLKQIEELKSLCIKFEAKAKSSTSSSSSTSSNKTYLSEASIQKRFNAKFSKDKDKEHPE